MQSEGITEDSDTSPYPARAMRQHERKGIFSIAFMKHALRCRVNELFGKDAFTILSVVVLNEDSLKRPVGMWNDDFISQVGCREETLIKTRKRLVDGGWLHYRPGGKGVQGLYWVKVPGGDKALDRPSAIDLDCGNAERSSEVAENPRIESTDFDCGNAESKQVDDYGNTETKPETKPVSFIPMSKDLNTNIPTTPKNVADQTRATGTEGRKDEEALKVKTEAPGRYTDRLRQAIKRDQNKTSKSVMRKSAG